MAWGTPYNAVGMVSPSRLAKTAALLPLLFVAALMLYVGFCTPLLTDDYLYVLTYTAEDDFGHLITGLQEWWESSLALFIHMNARLANPLASLALYLFGRPAFTLLNTLCLLLCALCLQRLFFRSCGGWGFVITAAAFLLVMPCPEGTLMWADGSANYLWPTAVFLLLLFPLRSLLAGEQLSRPMLVLTYVGSVFCAWMHEALGAPVSAALFFTFLTSKTARTKEIFALTCTFGIGVLPIICSPATWNRATASTAEPLVNLGYSASGFFTFTLIPALVTAALFFLIQGGRSLTRGLTAKLQPTDIFTLYLWGSTFLVSLAVGRIGNDGRGYYFHALAILLILLRLLGTRNAGNGKMKVCITAAAIGVLAFYSYSLVRSAEYAHKAHEDAYAQALSGKRICVVDSVYRNPRISAWLPTHSPRSVWFLHGGKYGHVAPYYVITNEFVSDKRIYQQFNGLAEDEPQVLRHANLTIVRLPKGLYCDAGRLKAIETESGKEAVFLPSHSFLERDWLIATAKRKTINTLGHDYHDGFHYLILIKKKDVPTELQIFANHEYTQQDTEITINI